MVCETGIVNPHWLLPYLLHYPDQITGHPLMAFKIIVLTYATFQDCDKDCNSLDMQLVTWSITQLPTCIGTL